MTLTVDPLVKLQSIIGFGASITDAAAYVLTDLLDAKLADEVLRQAFVFANFSMARVPMNAADFSRMDYSLAHELDLSDFCLRDDRTPDGEVVNCGEDYKLDVLERIVQLQPVLKLIVSSWSAPPSFKTQKFSCVLNSHVIECSPDPTVPPQNECIRTVSDPTTCLRQPQGIPCKATPPHNFSNGYPLNPGTFGVSRRLLLR